MTDRDDLRDRLDALEEQFGVGPTVSVLAIGDEDGKEWPADVDESDIMHRTEEPGINTDEPMIVEEPIIPIHRPPEYRVGS